MPCPVGIEINSCARMSLMIRRAPQAAQLTDKAQAMMKISKTACTAVNVRQNALMAWILPDCWKKTIRIIEKY